MYPANSPSPIINGTPEAAPANFVEKAEFSPIPSRALLHFVAILDKEEHVLTQFLEAIARRCPSIKLGNWKVIEKPRSCSFVDFEVASSDASSPWRYRLIYDPQGLPPALEPTIFAFEPSAECQEVIDRQRAAALMFLVDGPSQNTPATQGWIRFREFLEPVWAWLDAGAELLCFPEGRVVLPRRVLLHLEPEQLTPEHAYLFLTNGIAHRGDKSFWLRTWGLGQFTLPDLTAEIATDSHPEILERSMESLRLLFETLPPAMIADHGILPEGGQVQTGSVGWTATSPPVARESQGYLASRCGIQEFSCSIQ
jgi:hypothetical protein